jgi:hypothetical protein
LTEVEQNALATNYWNPDIWEDAIGGPGVVDVDPLQDPVFWIVSVLSIGRLSSIAIPTIRVHFCLDGDCGNELDVLDYALQRMEQRGISVNQLNATLQQKPFEYFHDGLWKLGYYDPATQIFVAVYDGVIKTVINNVNP